MSEDKEAINRANAQFQLANVWRIRGKQQLAIKAYQEALRANEAHVPSALELSSLLLDAGLKEDALIVCIRTLDSNPYNILLQRRISEIESIRSEVERDSVKAISGERDSRYRSGSQQDSLDPNASTVLFYTDCSGTDGAEQCGHIVMLDLIRAGYRVICVQGFANHHLVEERTNNGISHYWIEEEDLYSSGVISGEIKAGDDDARIFRETSPDLILFSDGSPFSSLAAKQQARQLGIPYLIWNHCVDEEWMKRCEPLAQELESAFAGADEVIAVSRQNLESLRESFPLSRTKGIVIHNGRPARFFSETSEETRVRLRSELSIPENAVICITVARMEIMKGYQYLIESIKLLKNEPEWERLHFIWAGEGTLRSRLQAQVSELSAEARVHFLGQRPDVDDLLGASDMFILPSQYEGMPLSVIEAMAKGLPVAATAVSGTPDALGDAGRLLENPRVNKDRLVEQISKVVKDWASQAEERAFIGAACKNRAMDLFSSSRMLEQYRKLIQDIIAR